VVVFKFRNLKNGQATPIPPGEYTIGRADNAYVHLDDASVSRQHARLLSDEMGFFIEDLGSANGTAVRGAYIKQRMKIGFGDTIYIGSVPFRIDPEVAGEQTAAPSAGLRTLNRAYMRRHTEKLPPGEIQRTVEAVTPELLSAPQVNPETDEDAAQLNAIVMTEPQASSPPGIPPRRGTGPVPVVRPPVAAAMMENSTPHRVPQQPQPSLKNFIQAETPVRAVPVTPLVAVDAEMSAPRESNHSAGGLGTAWLILIFLAGLGVGLLLGLVFAKLFLDMGGTPALLP
jgi:predicted component of type VI protein secretion system